MAGQYYDAKEAMKILDKPTTSFYREVREGKIPHVGKRPHMRFPKEAIDALAEVGIEEVEEKLIFEQSTIADAWTKQEITRQPYSDDDAVPFKTVLEWRKRNNGISMHVRDSSRLVGWVTFLPLDESIIQALIEDKLREKDIPPQAVRKWTDKRVSVYIPIIEVVPSGNKQKDKDRGIFLIRHTIKWGLTLTIQHDIKNWYGIGTSTEGQAILEAVGFEQINNLYDGERRGYILTSITKPAKLVSHYLKMMEAQDELAIPEKVKQEINL